MTTDASLGQAAWTRDIAEGQCKFSKMKVRVYMCVMGFKHLHYIAQFCGGVSYFLFKVVHVCECGLEHTSAMFTSVKRWHQVS